MEGKAFMTTLVTISGGKKEIPKSTQQGGMFVNTMVSIMSPGQLENSLTTKVTLCGVLVPL